MAGHRFVVSGDPRRAMETVLVTLRGQGFEVTQTGEWAAQAERGSKGASIALGAFAGKSGRHVKLDISCMSDGQGNLVIALDQGTSGWSGGLIGKGQAEELYTEVYNSVGTAFYSAGVLLSGGPVV